ncbi:MAG: sigma-54 factor interaction domain-containing protein [Polyangiales bacterium]
MFDAQTVARLEAIGTLGFSNPFGAERPRLEAIIVGEEAARSVLWNRPIDWPLEDPVLPAIQREAERELHDARTRMAAGERPNLRDRKLIAGVALYVLYYRYDAKLFTWITTDPTPNQVPFYDDFCADFHALLEGLAPPAWAPTPADLFALFFQTRRAFHFVFHQILGTSASAASLRASVWESLFTHDVWRYLGNLQGRMHEVSTLVLGPSGTGKELVASALGLSAFIPFDDSRRRFSRDFRWTFHPLNLAAMSKTLIESELFGHKKGAFTGAQNDRKGHFEDKAPADTVFLDEIGELDPEIQVKLLRVLQSRSFHRLGDSEPRVFGGKIIAATNRDLSKEMSKGRFREDLYYRLCADIIHTPSLREQLAPDSGELERLVTVLLQRTLGVADSRSVDEVMSSIDAGVGLDYAWPGNIRELEQCVRNILIHGSYTPTSLAASAYGLDALFARMRDASVGLDEVANAYSTWAYARTGSYARAGALLGVDRRTVAKHVDAQLLDSLGGVQPASAQLLARPLQKPSGNGND